jgi:glycosyltransferase involved in cell wall biosynthesis
LRIVHISSVHNLRDPRFALKMCPALARAGHDVHIVIPGEDIPPAVAAGGVAVHLTPKPRNRRERMFKTAPLVFRTAASLNGDIYHFHDPEGLPYALRWQKRLRRPFVYDIHENYPDDILTKAWLPRRFLKIIAAGFALYEAYAARRLSALAAATEHIAGRFKDHSRCVVVHNYPLLDELYEERQTAAGGLFVYAGGLSLNRGLKEMLEAINLAAPPAALALAGSFEDDGLAAYCGRMPGWPRAHYHGVLNRIELRDLLSRAAAGLALLRPDRSFIEARPIKIFEYMSASLPVVASDFPLWREIIQGAECGLLVDPLKPAAIAEAMNYITEHPAEAAAMGRRGRLAVERQYNWEAEFPRLLKLYEDLC